MDPKYSDLQLLIRKYIAGQCNSEEISRINTYINEIPQNDLEDVFSGVWESLGERRSTGDRLLSAEENQKILANVFASNSVTPSIEDDDQHRPSGIRPLWKGLAWIAACSVAALLGFFWLDRSDSQDSLGTHAQTYVSERDAENVAPGQNEAMLTTDGMGAVVLSGGETGVISEGDDYKLIRLASGEIQYQGLAEAEVAQWHTVTTPRGGHINFILPDGSKVWLNAASSIRFKSDMASRERRVIMQGEAYFEVEKVMNRTFVVENDFGRVEVLGTKFNVNAYDPTNIQTALLEGSVRLRTAASVVEMVPKQVATIGRNGKIGMGYKENIDDLIAWTSGHFLFEDADIQNVAAQLSRWYNVETSINSTPVKVTGKIARNIQLSKMIDMLDYLGMSCVYRDGKLIMNDKN